MLLRKSQTNVLKLCDWKYLKKKTEVVLVRYLYIIVLLNLFQKIF